MIDWSKLGPANAPTPATPDTTAPVGPAVPGSIPTIPNLSTGAQPYETGHGYHATQAQFDAMGPADRLASGFDALGQTLFGQGNGSPLGGIGIGPFSLGNAVGAVGNVAHDLGATGVKPFEIGAAALARVPLGWATGSDKTFDQLGEWAKTNNPQVYQQWQNVNAAANGDVLAGGNMKADFNTEMLQFLDDQQHDSSLGESPILAIGGSGVGSLGGGLSHAIQGWLGVASNKSQLLLGNAGFFDPQAHERLQAGTYSRNRVEESAARLDAGGEISDIEKQAVEAYRSGAWSLQHSEEFLVSHGQGITRNAAGQIIGTALTDPLTFATLGAGSIAKAGAVGAKIAESGFDAATAYEKAAASINAVQQGPLGPAFRIARGLIDPLAVYKPSTVSRAVTDLRNGVALDSFQRAYGPQTVSDLRAIAREFEKTDEIDSAVASYSIDQANLMVARKVQRDTLVEGLGEDLVQSNVDDVIDPIVRNASKDAGTELTDHMMRIAKNTFTAEEEGSLAGRLAATFGNGIPYWAKRIEGMSQDLKSALHAVTYKRAEVEFEQARAAIDTANYTGDLPLRNMVLMTTDTLDNIRAQGIIDNIRGILGSGEDAKIKTATNEWNAQARRFPALDNIGRAPGGQEQLQRLVDELEKELKSGGLSRRATDEELNDAAIRPVRDMLDRHAGPDGRLWNVGFRPDEEVAWGLKRDVNTGRYVVKYDPTISHVVDAVPGRQPFSDTTRNALGQIIGKSKAERLNAPIDSIEAMTNTMRDVVTGRRLVANIEKRFERSTFDAGIPKSISKEIFAKAREVAGLDYTTVRGINPNNLRDAVHEIIPRDLRLADGSTLDIHIVMDHLLRAAEGDLRIMGVSSVLSQRMRNALRTAGIDPANWAGQMTVTMYNKLRYSQPMFLIQRITDAPYYSILYGVTPVGKVLKGSNAELRVVEENLGRTGLARDFSMDMPEYATRSNFTAGIKSKMQEMGLKANKLEQIKDAPNVLIANQMTNMLHARLGDIVKGVLDNLATAAEQGDPAFKADMLAAGEELQRSFADWRRVYSEQAGRWLDDNEVGLRYIQDQLSAWRRHVVNADGTQDFSRLVAEGERSMPNSIADIGPIKPDILANELGYADGAALRRDVMGHVEKIKGEFTLVKGESDINQLSERLREELHAHPDYVRRVEAYFGETWDDFWSRLSRGVDQGGLDISPHYAKEAQDLIAATARGRGMDPWEYLSGVMSSNIGAQDLETYMGQLMGFLKSGKAKQPLEEWTKVFRATLDPSAQAKLIQEFEAAVPVESVIPNIPKPAKFSVDAKGNAVLPAGYTPDPGYVYRIEKVDAARGGWPKKTGVSTEANPMYVRGDPGEGVFRTKADPKSLATGRHGTGGKDRLTTGITKPEDIEMLNDNGQWVSLGEDPMTKIMAKDFPDAVRQRIVSGVPHADPEIEGYMQALSKWVQESIGGELGERTRADLRRLVEQVPTAQATSFNRSQALVVSLLKDKIEQAQTDIFRLAEMQTKRSVLERSLNHPLFALYPASYMWGKVLPETVKFLSKNPYAATYVIADVQRAIAVQREYDREMDSQVSAVDRSAGAFLLDYLTPSLPWSDHSARLSPMVRDLLKGDPGSIWSDELSTVSPDRWISQVARTVGEIPGAVGELGGSTPKSTMPDALKALAGSPAPAAAPGTSPQITGPTKASALAPILQDDLSRLSSILLEGQKP